MCFSVNFNKFLRTTLEQLRSTTSQFHFRFILAFKGRVAGQWWKAFQYIYKSQRQPPQVFYIKGALKYFAKFTRKHLSQSLLFNKVAAGAWNFKTLAQVFSSKFCEIFKNLFFTEHFWTTAFEKLICLKNTAKFH